MLELREAVAQRVRLEDDPHGLRRLELQRRARQLVVERVDLALGERDPLLQRQAEARGRRAVPQVEARDVAARPEDAQALDERRQVDAELQPLRRLRPLVLGRQLVPPEVLLLDVRARLQRLRLVDREEEAVVVHLAERDGPARRVPLATLAERERAEQRRQHPRRVGHSVELDVGVHAAGHRRRHRARRRACEVAGPVVRAFERVVLLHGAGALSRRLWTAAAAAASEDGGGGSIQHRARRVGISPGYS